MHAAEIVLPTCLLQLLLI